MSSEDREAPMAILAVWIAWRRAKDNEATALRKELGLCINTACKYLAIEDTSRCEKHTTGNAEAAARFHQKHSILCKHCNEARSPRASFDDEGRCYFCRKKLGLTSAG